MSYPKKSLAFIQFVVCFLRFLKVLNPNFDEILTTSKSSIFGFFNNFPFRNFPRVAISIFSNPMHVNFLSFGCVIPSSSSSTFVKQGQALVVQRFRPIAFPVPAFDKTL